MTTLEKLVEMEMALKNAKSNTERQEAFEVLEGVWESVLPVLIEVAVAAERNFGLRGVQLRIALKRLQAIEL